MINSVESLINDFLEHYQNINSSEKTIINYKVDLKQFKKWLDTQIFNSFEELTIKDFEKFISQFYTPVTAQRKLSSLRMFYNFLQRENIVSSNLPKDVRPPTKTKKIPDIITEKEARKMIKVAEQENEEKPTLETLRSLLIVKLFLNTGIRREELLSIKMCDVVLRNNVILINGKGDKQRWVTINNDVKNLIKAYIALSKPKTPDDNLFQLSGQSINTIINTVMKSAGCKKDGRSCHTLRKRFASNSYEKTQDIYAVAQALGHSDLKTIERYAEVDKNRIKNAFAAVSF